MRILVAGTPETALPAIESMADSAHELLGVITRPEAAAGRGRASRPSPVHAWAQDHSVPVFTPAHPGDAEFVQQLRELNPDCIPVIAYGALLPESVLDIPQHGWINLHFSLLPAWRGAAPVQRALLAGDAITGASVFRIEKGLDTGPVFGTVTEAVRADDTTGSLLNRLSDSGAKLLVDVLDALESGDIEAVPQSSEGVSHAPKLTVAEMQIPWAQASTHVHRLSRAAAPTPGAWTMFRGKRVKIGPLELPETAFEATDPTPVPPGRIVFDGNDVFVGTGSSLLRLTLVQPEGKRMMPVHDWLNGIRLESGEGFQQSE